MRDKLSLSQASPLRGAAGGALAFAFWSLVGASCVLDSDDRCGPNQVISEDGEICLCDATSAYTPNGCVPCGANEAPGPGGCVCAPGFSRSSPAAACEELSGGIGAPCTTDAECTDAAYPHCQTSLAGDGYCTTAGCTAAAECGGGYDCDVNASPTYCRRPPTGNGTACATDADCTGFDASYCENVVSSTCLVAECTLDPDSCAAGTECCAIPGFPNLCLAVGLCQ